MTADTTNDWNPETYARFRGLRLTPALDLLGRIVDLPAGDVIDLGCGNGAVAGPLRARFPDRALVGVDRSQAMLEQAGTATYSALVQADIAAWSPDRPVALVFSNAALHWLPDHATLFPRIMRWIAPGGALAVQMPRQQMAPSHQLLRDVAAAMFPDRFNWSGWTPQVSDPATYLRLLAPFGQTEVWETEYQQRLAPVTDGHPVRHFTASTAMRPIAEHLTRAELEAFIARYDAALARVYPAEADGAVLFPFRRLFLTVTRD